MSSVLTVTFKKVEWPPDGWSCCPFSKLHFGKLFFLSFCFLSFLF